MSFSSEVKKELASIKSCVLAVGKAEAYGLILFSKNFSVETLSIQTKNRSNIESVYEFLVASIGVIVEIRTKLSRKGDSSVELVIPYKNDRQKVIDFFKINKNNQFNVNYENIKNEKEIASFLRGIFLICGTITDPNKEYRLEFSVQNEVLAEQLYILLLNIGISISPKLLKKNNRHIIYLRGNEQISDFLVYIGAKNKAMDLMQIKMVKEVRNYVNRTTNFQTANLDKTVTASTKQIKDIEYIMNTKGLNWLPEDLREIAKIKINSPDMSLKEIGNSLSKPISKSGVNHRLQKIINIAEELKKEREDNIE